MTSQTIPKISLDLWSQTQCPPVSWDLGAFLVSHSEHSKVWTLEARALVLVLAGLLCPVHSSWCQGDLIGGAADFVQKICIEQFGIQDDLTH